MSGEFDMIAELFAPLAEGAGGAHNLTDDVAELAAGAYVVTADMMIEGVHFRKADPIDLVARKLLRVNLSDLAAKGAKPLGYFLTCAWPKSVTRQKIEKFVSGLSADQEAFRVALYGGDTTRHTLAAAPMSFSVTMFGAPPRQGITRRNGAKPGDDLWVTGAIGDAALGLAALEKREACSAANKKHLAARYQLPEPRITMGGALSGSASASIDVSDGLVADASHIARTSGCGFEIRAGDIPLSDAARGWLDNQEDADQAAAFLACGGDDYEILFTAPQRARRAVEMAAQVSKTPVTRIGGAVRGESVRLVNGEDESIDIANAGFDHFAGR